MPREHHAEAHNPKAAVKMFSRLASPPRFCRELPNLRASLLAQGLRPCRSAFQPAKMAEQLCGRVLLTRLGCLPCGDLDDAVGELVRVNGHL
jgi:hypothetical protein